jgi:hypothetical protein
LDARARRAWREGMMARKINWDKANRKTLSLKQGTEALTKYDATTLKSGAIITKEMRNQTWEAKFLTRNPPKKVVLYQPTKKDRQEKLIKSLQGKKKSLAVQIADCDKSLEIKKNQITKQINQLHEQFARHEAAKKAKAKNLQDQLDKIEKEIATQFKILQSISLEESKK